MTALEKLKAALCKFIGIEDDPHEECDGCKLLNAVIAERDELIAEMQGKKGVVMLLQCPHAKEQTLAELLKPSMN